MAARKKLGEILIQAGVIDETQLRAGLNEQRRWGGPIGRILVDMKLITEDAMVQALSHQLNLPAVHLDQRTIERQVADLVPGDLCEQHGVMPFYAQGKFLDVAMSDPTNLGIVDELRIRTRMNVRAYLAGPKAIERAISRHYGRGVARVDFAGGAPGNLVGAAASAVDPNAQLGARTFDEEELAPPARVPDASGPSAASARRARQFQLAAGVAQEDDHGRELRALQERVQHLEALIARDEDVLRKLLTLFVEKGVATREEILDRIK